LRDILYMIILKL